MKPKATGALSGCIVWIIAFSILISCIFPLAMVAGMFSSITSFAMEMLAPALCPEGTTAEPYSYPTTTTDEYGNSQPTTAYEMHCVDANDVVVKKDTGLYVFVWTGIIILLGLVIAALLAFAVAIPTGIAITQITNRRQKTDISVNIEPH